MLLERVRSQPILGMKLNKGGNPVVPGRSRRWLARRLQAGANRFADHPRKEVAAYRLNRLLGLTQCRRQRLVW